MLISVASGDSSSHHEMTLDSDSLLKSLYNESWLLECPFSIKWRKQKQFYLPSFGPPFHGGSFRLVLLVHWSIVGAMNVWKKSPLRALRYVQLVSCYMNVNARVKFRFKQNKPSFVWGDFTFLPSFAASRHSSSHLERMAKQKFNPRLNKRISLR